MMPDTLRKDSDHNYIRITWENHGVAPAYHQFKLFIRLVNRNKSRNFIQQLTESDNRSWLPDEIVAEQYVLNLDQTLAMGKYELLISLQDDCGFHNRKIQLAMKQERETEPGWYKLGEIFLE
jgi:hypothetical protein